jgi:hypothetical protein
MDTKRLVSSVLQRTVIDGQKVPWQAQLDGSGALSMFHELVTTRLFPFFMTRFVLKGQFASTEEVSAKAMRTLTEVLEIGFQLQEALQMLLKIYDCPNLNSQYLEVDPNSALCFLCSYLVTITQLTIQLMMATSKSKLCYDRWSVILSVLVSSTQLGPMTRSLLVSDSCRFVMGHPLTRGWVCRLQLLTVPLMLHAYLLPLKSAFMCYQPLYSNGLLLLLHYTIST